jgi:hypothetical protein
MKSIHGIKDCRIPFLSVEEGLQVSFGSCNGSLLLLEVLLSLRHVAAAAPKGVTSLLRDENSLGGRARTD